MRNLQRLLLLSSVILLAPLSELHASITGAVIDRDGKAIPGARVSLFAPETLDARHARLVSKAVERVPLATTQSDSKGNFTFESPKEPVVDVSVDAAGFAPDTVRSLADDDIGAVALLAAPLVKGVIRSGGKPVAGAVVVWSGQGEWQAVTDAEGRYSVPDPSRWASRLTIVHPDFAVLEETLRQNQSKESPDRTLNAGVSISGRVVAEDGQTAVANAAILVNHWKLGATAADGAFTVNHAPKDWTQVEAESEEKSGFRAHADAAVTIRMAKAASVAGTVVDLKTKLPVAGVDVYLAPGNQRFMGGGRMAASPSAMTDAKGRYQLKPVVPGIYEIEGVRPSAVITGGSLSISAGQNVIKPLYLTAQGRVSGSVVDEDKRPVSGASLNARPATRDPMMNMMMFGPRQGGMGGAFSAPDGHFVLRSVPTEADLRIDAVRKGSPPAVSGSIRVASGERKSGVLISIPHGIALTGKVVDHDGKPLSGVTVDAAEASAAEGPGGMVRRMVIGRMQQRPDETIRTASDGTFTTKVKEGTYDVIFKREGFATKSARAVVVSATSKPLQITLDPGLEVTGRVTRGGVGVEGVNVAVIGGDGFSSAVTQADGSFRVEDLNPGTAMLSVNKPDASIQQMRSVTIPARDVVIDLPQGGRVVGRVVDKATKQPITAFQAGMTTSRGGGGMVVMMAPNLKSFTSDDGSFILENVPPGPGEVVANAPGYTTGRSALTVEDGKTASGIEVALDTGVRLTGRVTGPDGSPLPGVSVRLDSSPGAMRNVMRMAGSAASAVTDPNGDYTIESLESGEKTFVFAHEGLVSQEKTVDLSGDHVTLNVQLTSGASVTGVVVAEGGGAVADALVTATSAGETGFGRQARTDASGAFQFEGLSGSHYTLTAAKSGYANAIQRDVDITAGTPIRLVLTAGGILSGHVTGLSDHDLQQTTVTAQGTNGNVSAPVDASGSYHIEGVPLGTVRVMARVGTGIGGLKMSAPKTVQIDAGTAAQVDLEFQSGTVIRGRITRNGQPMTSAMVTFFPKSGRTSSSMMNGPTDSAGVYEIAGLEDGTYNVQVTDMQRLSPFMTSYDVHGSGTFDIDIKSSAIRGRVSDATTGAAINDAHVELRTPGGDTLMSMRSAQTDSTGSFSIDDVARGNYEAVATGEGYGHQTLNLLVGDATDPLDFKLTPTTGVTLRVVDARDQHPIGASARVMDSQGRVVPVGNLFSMGSTEPLKLTLAAGSYRITLSAPGYASQTLTVNSPSDQTVGLSPGGSLVLQARGSASVRARLIDSNGSAYIPANRGPFASPNIVIEAAPASTTLQNVAPGHYRLEILDGADHPVRSIDIIVTDGQSSSYQV